MEASPWAALDAYTLLSILKHLSLKDLAAISQVNKQLRALCFTCSLYQGHLAADWGLHIKVKNQLGAARSLLKALVQQGKGDDPGGAHLRYQAVFTDGGVDENMWGRFWADRAFQCNGWGAFCSKISPNIHVVGLLKGPNSTEERLLHLRILCAELCKWAIGRLLARVPVPSPTADLTQRQIRFFRKAAASLLRWHHKALFRLFCVLYKKRQENDVIGQTLDLGAHCGLLSSHNTSWHESLEAVFGPEHAVCQTGISPPTRPGKEAGQAGPSSGPSSKGYKRIQAALAWVTGNKQPERLLQPKQYMDQVLQPLYLAVLPYAKLPAEFVLPQLQDSVQPLSNAEYEAMQSLATGASCTVLNVACDEQKLRVQDVQQAERLEQPAEIASISGVMDMISISRAGNFTCPVRSGIVMLGTITSATSSPTAWLTECAAKGQHLHPPPVALPPGTHAHPSRSGQHTHPAPLPAQELLAKVKAGSGVDSGGTGHHSTVRQEYLHAIVNQPASKVLNSMATCEQVLSAVKDGRLPRITQHKLLLNAEVIEFESVSSSRELSEPAGAAAAAAGRAIGQDGQAVTLVTSPVPLQPVVWFRFFTRNEVKYMWALFRMHCQWFTEDSNPRERQFQPWTALPDHVLQQYRTKYTKLWQKAWRQQRDEGAATAADSVAGEGGRQAAGTPKREKKRGKAARGKAPVPSDQELLTVMPQQVVTLSREGALVVLPLDECYVGQVSFEQLVWGMEMERAREFAFPGGEGRGAVVAGVVAGLPVVDDGGGDDDEDDDDAVPGGSDSWSDGSGALSDFEAAIDNMEEGGIPMDNEPAADVEELLDMMGYDPMQVEAAAGAELGSGGGSDSDDSMFSSGSSSSGSQQSDDEDMAGGSEGDGSDGWGDSDDEDLLGSSMDDDDLDIMQQFPDLLDENPPTPTEYALIHALTNMVGLETIQQSHLELERECQSIIDEVHTQSMASALIGQPAPTDQPSQPNKSGPAGTSTAKSQAGGHDARSVKSKRSGRQSRGSARGSGVRSGAADVDTEPPESHEPFIPCPNVPITLLPGDETAMDSSAFKPIATVFDMRERVTVLQLPLHQRRSANLVCLKLISPEDRMEEMADPHDDPNIDVQFTAFRGKAFMLPDSLEQLRP